MIMTMSASRAELDLYSARLLKQESTSIHVALLGHMDLYSARLLKQQSTSIHVALLGHIILIQSQTVFVLNVGWELSGEAENNDFIFSPLG